MKGKNAVVYSLILAVILVLSCQDAKAQRIKLREQKSYKKLGQDVGTVFYAKGDNEIITRLHFTGKEFGYGLGYTRHLLDFIVVECILNYEKNSIYKNTLTRYGVSYGVGFHFLKIRNDLLLSANLGFKTHYQVLNIKNFETQQPLETFLQTAYAAPSIKINISRHVKIGLRYSFEYALNETFIYECKNNYLWLDQYEFLFSVVF